MHEYGIAQEVIKSIEKYANGNKADRPVECWVQFGPLCGINPEAIESVFPLASKGTMCEKMTLNVHIEPAVCKCRDCGNKTTVKEYTDIMMCESCGSVNIKCPPSAQKIYLAKLKLETKNKAFILNFSNVEMEEEHHHD